MPAERTRSRVERILVLVPWIVAHPDATVTQICERFGVTRDELAADVELLFMCGLPPFGPGDLIEAQIVGEHVSIAFADHLAKPLRFTRSEALELIVMGRALAELPGLQEAGSLRSALDKLEAAATPAAASTAREVAPRVAIDIEAQPAAAVHAMRLAMQQRRKVTIDYYSFGRGEMTKRTVCPLAVFTTGAFWYIEAFDERSGEERVFRADRIRELVPAGERCTEHEPRPATEFFRANEHDISAQLDLAPAASWVRERTPHDQEETLPDGWTRITLRTPNLPWLERLLVQLGDQARVVSPPELADGMKEVAAQALARYSA